jgi:glutamine amidotransferase-like uncharacterized protein
VRNCVLGLLLFTFLSSASFAQFVAPTAKPIALVFGYDSKFDTNGICEGCDTDLGKRLTAAGFDVRIVHPGQITDALLAKAKVFVMPGGGEETVVKDMLKPGEVERIKKFVENGGSYLGICLGGFIAAPRISNDKNYEKYQGLDLFQGHIHAHSPIVQLKGESYEHAVKRAKAARLETITWQGKPRLMYFQDGPEFELADPKKAEIWAYYDDHKIAAFQTNLGKGRVGLIGTHPEADDSWYQEEKPKLPTPANLSFDALDDFITHLTGVSANAGKACDTQPSQLLPLPSEFLNQFNVNQLTSPKK